MAKRVNISKDYLEKLYINEKLNTYQIADKIGCCQGTVWNKLKKYNIPRRPSNPPVNISKEELIDLYWNKKLSTWKIEKLTGVSRGSIHRKMKEWGIKIRNISESHIIYPKKDFDGGELLQAYLVGFSEGDLRVRMAGKEKSETIKLDCGSTKNAQIDLIEALFSPYGRVWISRIYEKDKRQIEAFLNQSFDFLLKKEIPQEYFEDKTLFFAFFTGFTDAEGSIYISQGKANYSLGNCDYNILKKIKFSLEKFGIRCSNVNLGMKKGWVNPSNGYILNEDYWQLTVGGRLALLKLLFILRQHSQHKDRKYCIEEGLKNIINHKTLWKPI
jgi:intein-encoded DNA endonuclease-like protein